MCTSENIVQELSINTTLSNGSMEFDLPIDMQFNEGHVVSIVTYSVLMVISAIGNTTVLMLILRRKCSKLSRINIMLMHLAIADLLQRVSVLLSCRNVTVLYGKLSTLNIYMTYYISRPEKFRLLSVEKFLDIIQNALVRTLALKKVTFLMMPLEIGWAITVSWKAGDIMCRIMAFFRIFGLYLSSFILICISIDRYYAVLRPLQLIGIDNRGKVMILGAWLFSILCSIPQIIVFHVEKHPIYTWYEQCITFNTFPSFTHELSYSLFGMLMMYWVPLVVIIYTYTSILTEIYKRSKASNSGDIRRSSLGFLGQAKIRTLKMTIMIVVVFFTCWTPYYIMSFWYWVDRTSATKVDQRIQRALFLFACTNSCMNPVVYGVFNIKGSDKVNILCTTTCGLRKEYETQFRRSVNQDV